MKQARRRIAILSVLLLIASAALAFNQHAAMVEAHDRSDLMVGAAARERQVEEAQADAADATDARSEEVDRGAHTIDGRALDAIAARQWLDGRMPALGVQIEALEAELADISAIDSTQLITIVGLQTCLEGIRNASIHQIAGDDAAVVAELQRVEDFCRATMASLGINGGSGFAFDFADPFVLPFQGEYFAYATNAGAGAVQLISSPDLEQWTLIGEALQAVPAWAEPGATWAPSVAEVGDDWILYYTVRERSSGLQCISSAVASTPRGPFVDDSDAPLMCQRDRGGSIDPSPFVDDEGRVNLLWKSDEVVKGRIARIWVMPLDDSGRKPGWFPVELGHSDRPWENRVIEGPAMVEHDGSYYVLYSGNHWGTVNYSVGYLRCDTPLGPCTKPADNVVLASHGTQNGPGGTEVFRAFDGTLEVAYHAWEGSDIGYPNKRRIHTAPLTFSGGRPAIG